MAKSSGIDGFAVSWWGPNSTVYPGVTDTNFRKVLEVAGRLDFKVAIYFESYAFGHPTSPAQLERMLRYFFLNYADDPRYFKLNGLPLIFVYSVSSQPITVWHDILNKMEKEGHNAFYVADTAISRYFGIFQGIHRYFPEPEYLNDIYDTLSGAARTRRLLFLATIIPGADGRQTTWAKDLFYPRKDGQMYKMMFRTALAYDPDWILITSFNEWWENTHIEPGQTYRYQYLYATELYASQFKGQKPDYDGIPVPLAIWNATSAIQQAEKDGRTAGLDVAQQYLQNAETAFDFTHDYGAAASFARKAVDAAKAADYPKSYYEAKGLLAEAESLKANATAANFTSTQAKTLFNEGVSAFWQAEYAYRQGDYNATITYAQAAVRFFEQAFQAERTARTFPLVQLRFHYEYLAAAAVIILIVLAAPRLRRNAKRNGELT